MSAGAGTAIAILAQPLRGNAASFRYLTQIKPGDAGLVHTIVWL